MMKSEIGHVIAIMIADLISLFLLIMLKVNISLVPRTIIWALALFAIVASVFGTFGIVRILRKSNN